MKNRITTFIQPTVMTLILLFCATSCNTPKGEDKTTFDLATAKKEIEEANRNFMDILSKGDSVGLANCFTTDAKFMGPNSPAVSGRTNIQSVVASIINSGATKLDLRLTEVWGTEELVAEEGEFTLATKENTQLDKGKYIVLWKKEDGKWKLFRDFFNSDLPIPTVK